MPTSLLKKVKVLRPPGTCSGEASGGGLLSSHPHSLQPPAGRSPHKELATGWGRGPVGGAPDVKVALRVRGMPTGPPVRGAPACTHRFARSPCPRLGTPTQPSPCWDPSSPLTGLAHHGAPGCPDEPVGAGGGAPLTDSCRGATNSDATALAEPLCHLVATPRMAGSSRCSRGWPFILRAGDPVGWPGSYSTWGAVLPAGPVPQGPGWTPLLDRPFTGRRLPLPGLLWAGVGLTHQPFLQALSRAAGPPGTELGAKFASHRRGQGTLCLLGSLGVWATRTGLLGCPHGPLVVDECLQSLESRLGTLVRPLLCKSDLSLGHWSWGEPGQGAAAGLQSLSRVLLSKGVLAAGSRGWLGAGGGSCPAGRVGTEGGVDGLAPGQQPEGLGGGGGVPGPPCLLRGPLTRRLPHVVRACQHAGHHA